MPDSLLQHLSAYALQILRLCIWLVLLVIIFLPLERLFALHPSRIFRKDVAADLFYYFLSSLTPAVVLSAPMSMLAVAVHQFMPAAYLSWVGSLPLAVKALAALVVGEFGFYWGHRWSHEVPFLWGFHAIHHSAEHMDFLVNTRAHPIDLVFTRLCGMVPLYILGLAAPGTHDGSLLPVLVILAGTLWGFFIHSNIRWRLGPLEHLIATPAFHHWHHTNDRPQLYNKNYASMLPFLDRVFGTHHLPRNEHPQRYGIDQKLQPGVLGQLIGPFQQRKQNDRS